MKKKERKKREKRRKVERKCVRGRSLVFKKKRRDCLFKFVFGRVLKGKKKKGIRRRRRKKNAAKKVRYTAGADIIPFVSFTRLHLFCLLDFITLTRVYT